MYFTYLEHFKIAKCFVTGVSATIDS